MSKRKKKRNKKYRPTEGVPTIHRFVAEEESKKDTQKKLKRRLIMVVIIALPLGLLAWLVL